MATIRLRNLKGLSPETKRRIRQALGPGEETDQRRTLILPDPQPSNSKWHNVRTTVDGITFASKHEANRYAELKIEQLAGEITDLELQKPFSLDVNAVHICDYVADFVYRRGGHLIVEDAKGKRTDLYKIKRALMFAIYGVEIHEVF